MSVQRALPGLPTRYRGPAFRAIEAVLREDPVLAQWVKTWRSREGMPQEASLPVSADQLPMIALSPVPVPNTVLGVDETKINFVVAVEIAVPGSAYEDVAALWEAVEDAIKDGREMRGGTVRQFLCGVITPGLAGVMMLRPSQPAFREVSVLRQHPDDKQTTFQGGVGTLTCFLRRPA